MCKLSIIHIAQILEKKLEKESPLEKDKLELLNEINDTNADRLTEIYNHMYMETLRQKYKIMK